MPEKMISSKVKDKAKLYQLAKDRNSHIGRLFIDFINNETPYEPYESRQDNNLWWFSGISYDYDDLLCEEFNNFIDKYLGNEELTPVTKAPNDWIDESKLTDKEWADAYYKDDTEKPLTRDEYTKKVELVAHRAITKGYIDTAVDEQLDALDEMPYGGNNLIYRTYEMNRDPEDTESAYEEYLESWKEEHKSNDGMERE